MKLGLAIALIVIAAVVCGVAGFILGGIHRRKVAEAKIGSADQEAARIVSDALAQAESKKKEAILEAKDAIHKERTMVENELRERRTEIQKQERRMMQREESLDKKTDNLEKKEEALNGKIKAAEARLEEVETIKRSQFEMLEKISNYTKEQARDYLLKSLEDDLAADKSRKILEYEQKLRDECDNMAREVVSTAIQRCAADQVAEATVSVVALPNDEMKGR